MNLGFVEKIAAAVLYEGYILYPYTPSSVKNRQRWTFGGIYPKSYSEAQGGFDAWTMQTECLADVRENSLAAPRIELRIRFLHITERSVGRVLEPVSEIEGGKEPRFEPANSLQVGGKTYRGWQEAVEREVKIEELNLADLSRHPVNVPFCFPEGRAVEPIKSPDGRIEGAIIRAQEEIRGIVEISAERLTPELFKISARAANLTPLENALLKSRDEALMRSFVSTHAIIGIENGRLLSLIDAPAEFQKFASECRNIGNFPVLVGGGEGEYDALLCSPIILYDYPQIAPESAGDLFDATEIDEILTLRIMTLSEEEKDEIRAFDDKARRVLERAEAITRDEMMKLHGTMRDIRPLNREENPSRIDNSESARFEPEGGILGWDPLEEKSKPESVNICGVEVKPGDSVRLAPRSRGDIFDVALNGKTAVIESIEQDYEDRIYIVVMVDEDPGRDFGVKKMPGHRFFFSPEEIVPLREGERSEEDPSIPSDAPKAAAGRER